MLEQEFSGSNVYIVVTWNSSGVRKDIVQSVFDMRKNTICNYVLKWSIPVEYRQFLKVHLKMFNGVHRLH